MASKAEKDRPLKEWMEIKSKDNKQSSHYLGDKPDQGYFVPRVEIPLAKKALKVLKTKVSLGAPRSERQERAESNGTILGAPRSERPERAKRVFTYPSHDWD
jgi:hypothetical protein